MIFWILTVIAVAAVIVVVVWAFMEDGVFEAFVFGLLALIISGLLWLLLAGGLLYGISKWLGPNGTTTTSHNLKALGSDASTEGRFFFLGGGYIDGKRVLSYIRENPDGSFTPAQTDGEASRVWERDGAPPEMETHRHYSDRWWLAPGRTLLSTEYEFTIPEGSVAESYTVEP